MTRPSATLVGAFVLGALALAVAGVLFFGGSALRSKHFTIVSFFDGSVAGLRVGAPVTYRGVLIGEVKSIGVRVNSQTGQSIIQVNMQLVPHALTVYGAPSLPSDEALVPSLVRDGLTAQLVKQSFVTGLLSVELAFRPGEKVSRFGDASLPEVPTVPGDLEALTKQLQSVDIVAAIDSMQRTFASAEALLRNPGLKETLDGLPAIATSLQQTLGAVRSLATTLDRDGASTLATLRQTLEKSQGTLEKADVVLDGVQELTDPRGHMAVQAQRVIDDLAATSARLRNLAERVDRDPSVLVRGR